MLLSCTLSLKGLAVVFSSCVSCLGFRFRDFLITSAYMERRRAALHGMGMAWLSWVAWETMTFHSGTIRYERTTGWRDGTVRFGTLRQDSASQGMGIIASWRRSASLFLFLLGLPRQACGYLCTL
ncbi:hypothetical protein HDK77DRAFT_11445 [Phyllosticta capitalensis]